MPELSRFFGIVISMYREIGGRHHYPHIHADYGGEKAVFNIENAELIEGEFPSRERKLVEAWIEIHHDELLADWHALNSVTGTTGFMKIAPLAIEITEVCMMSHLTDWVIVRFDHIEPLTLKISFADQTTQLIDFGQILQGEWLKPLRDPEYFRQVRLNDVGNLEWPGGQDFNPEALHDWPAFESYYLQDGQRIEQGEKNDEVAKKSNTTVRKQHPRITKPRCRSRRLLPAKTGSE